MIEDLNKSQSFVRFVVGLYYILLKTDSKLIEYHRFVTFKGLDSGL